MLPEYEHNVTHIETNPVLKNMQVQDNLTRDQEVQSSAQPKTNSVLKSM